MAPPPPAPPRPASRTSACVVGVWCLVAAALLLLTGPADGLYLQGSTSSYAKFPRWDACINATISFEFKSTQESALLFYVDDGGRYDYIEVMLTSGRVRMLLNIVDEKDGYVEIVLGEHVNDGQWHRVEIRRKRMETTLIVDSDSDSRFAFGSDFHFGNVANNSYVYLGGIPQEFLQNLHDLSLPTAVYKPHLRGSVRNVLYSNCSCQTVRATMVSNIGGTNDNEACVVSDLCPEGCVCVSTDIDRACDCSQRTCVTGAVTHYELPMDLLITSTRGGKTIHNPSGLDATAFGDPPQLEGIKKKAIRLDGKNTYVRVSGPGHRYECFGDLDKCPLGYTMAFWVNFESPCDRQAVYLSNGGHSENSHGVAMLYDKGNMEFRFRRKNGQEWRVKSDDVLPGRWYHIAAAWKLEDGLSFYIDGDLVDTSVSPIVRSGRAINDDQFNDFIIGRPNDNTQLRDSCGMAMDEFNFWSQLKTADEIKEVGPFYCYNMNMDEFRGSELTSTNINAHLVGSPSKVTGKIGGAVHLDGRRSYVDASERANVCLGDLSKCLYGLTTSMWIKFDRLTDNSYFLDSGNKGMKVYYKDGKLVAETQAGNITRKASWDDAEADKWYFLEVTWDRDTGRTRMFVNQKEVQGEAQYRQRAPLEGGTNKLYLGRANTNMRHEKYGRATFDQVQMCYGNREKLQHFGYIQRGRPTLQFFNMDATEAGRNGLTRLVHPTLDVDLYGKPLIVPGKVLGALKLDGNSQYLTLGDQHASCLGNIDLCRQGLLFGTWIRPGALGEMMELFSTGRNGISAWYENGRVRARARTTTREWEVDTDYVQSNNWQFMEVAWTKEGGLALFVNGVLVAQSATATHRTPGLSSYHKDIEHFHIGRGEGIEQDAKYGNMTVDETEYWYGSRDYLLAHGYILRGRPEHYIFPMDDIRDGHVVHPNLLLPVGGDPSITKGHVENAVDLNGDRQYIDLGDHGDNCMGDLGKCTLGFTGSMWTNFNQFGNDMYLYSNGGGAKVFYKNGKLNFVFANSGKQWEVNVPDLETNQWYHLEWSWHPEKGLQVYVNNAPAGHDTTPIGVREKPEHTEAGHVYIGRPNPADDEDGRYRYGNFIIDNTEMWFSDRDYLLAFGHILRENVTHYSFPLDFNDGNRIPDKNFDIWLKNGANLVPAKNGNGLSVRGNGEYMTFGDQQNSCFGNLTLCEHGHTLKFNINPKRLVEDGYFVSSGPYQIYVKDGKTYFKYSTSTKTWEVSTNRIQRDKWQHVEVSWDDKKGLVVYVDDEQVAGTSTFVSHEPKRITDHNLYIGRPNLDNVGQDANALFDDIEVWFASRDHLEEYGLVNQAVRRVILNMDKIENNALVNPNVDVFVRGNAHTVTGVTNNAVYLNGRRQYMEADNTLMCAGDLVNCPDGFTLRFQIKPNTLVDGTYFVSSPFVDVYYYDGQLVAEVRTPNQMWTVHSPRLQTGDWHQVDLSWHPVEGLGLYINAERVHLANTPSSANPADYDSTRKFYIGRANTDMVVEKYPDAVFDNVEVWEKKRDILIDDGLIVSGPFIPPTRIPQTTTWHPSITTPKSPGPNEMIVFDGRQWVVYDFRNLPADYFETNDNEKFRIRFKTRQPNGLLWYTGNTHRNMHLSLQDGDLVLIVEYDGERDYQRFRISPSHMTLHDGNWHTVRINRRGRQINWEIDGQDLRVTSTLNKDFNMLGDGGPVYIGGSSSVDTLTKDHVHTRFNGDINEILINGNKLPENLDLIEMYHRKPRPSWILDSEDIDTGVGPPGSNGVTFTRKEAFLHDDRWDAIKGGSISFKFKTTELNGLMLYNGGRPGGSDFIAVEMFDGELYFVIDMAGRVSRYKFSAQGLQVNDGMPHYVKLDRHHQRLTLTLDAETNSHRIPSHTVDLTLGTFLFIGGVDNPDRLPWHLWTRNPKFFVGCIWDLTLNEGEPADLQGLMNDQGQLGVEPGCTDMTLTCSAQPCARGKCVDHWNDYYCDCAATDYTDKHCNKIAPIIQFQGSDFVRINIIPKRVTHTNDISIRFKTDKPKGLLFKTSNKNNPDYLSASLEGGRVKLQTNLGGETTMMFVCDELNDFEWHTLYIRRRANELKAWVDDCRGSKTNLVGEGYMLDIDQVLVAAEGRYSPMDDSFVGYMKNFFFDRYDFFPRLGDLQGGSTFVNNSISSLPLNPVTIRSGTDSYIRLPTFQVNGDLEVKIMFKTEEPNGLLMYSYGRGSQDFIALELVDGYVHFSANDGSGPSVLSAQSAGRLNNGEWHEVVVKQTGPERFIVTVDNGRSTALHMQHPPNSRHRFDFTSDLYIGGVPPSTFGNLPESVVSRQGFGGCLGTVKINKRLYDLQKDGRLSSTQFITLGCTDAGGFCNENLCLHYGTCNEAPNTYVCGCNMTAHVGRHCAEEPKGYHYGWNESSGGVVSFDIVPAKDTQIDQLAFGFMTWYPNGTLVRLDSGIAADYLHARLEDGHVVFEYDIGEGKRRIVEDRRKFNDGRYHYVSFFRRNKNAILRVDDYPEHDNTYTGYDKTFNEMAHVKLGGLLDYRGHRQDTFNGILGGVYLNGYRIIDLGHIGDSRVDFEGGVINARHPFHVVRPIPTVAPTKNPGLPIPGSTGSTVTDAPLVIKVPPGAGGGGVAWEGIAGTGGEDTGVLIGVEPGGGGAGVDTSVGGSSGIGGPAVGEYVGGAPPVGVSGGASEGARAAAVAGIFLGILTAVSSLAWALYKFKPGLISMGGGGGGGGMSISSPARAGTNLQAVKAAGGMGAGGGAGGGGGGASAVLISRVDTSAANGTAVAVSSGFANAASQTEAGFGPGGANAQSFHVLSGSAMAGSGVAGLMSGMHFTTRPVQTELVFVPPPPPLAHAQLIASGAYGGGGGSSMAEHMMASSMYESQFSGVSGGSASAAGGAGAGATLVKSMSNTETQTMQPSPPLPPQPLTAPLYESQTMGNAQMYQGGANQGYNEGMSSQSFSYKESSSFNEASASQQYARNLSPPPDGAATMAAANAYTMRNMALLDSTQTQAGVRPNIFMAAEEIRVDCMQLTDDGKFVVTGSIFGPPQVWDMRTGELVRVMAGEDLSSTDLHLACNDNLLVGQVAEMTQVDPSDQDATARVHHRKLQLWDFATGRPLEMSHNELCTASCVMSDGEKVVLGRTDKFGTGTSVVVWDLMGNEAVRRIKLDASVGFADYISFLQLSKDNRYVVAGFQNSYDGNANYLIFDLSRDDQSNQHPKIIALDAQAECSAMLENHEVVTGTRNGELIIWSLRTGKALRQLASPTSGTMGRGPQATSAHTREVNCLTVSKDGQYLVSGSSDHTLKVWSLESEKHLFTLRGHSDEVWCCAVSYDNDFIVSGSKDTSIRVWRMQNGIPVTNFNTGVDVFSVQISNHKKTVVALGDKFGARKLIMLQVVKTKTRSRTGSRATSPLGPVPEPHQFHPAQF